MSILHFPQLNLGSDDPDLRYMALFDFSRKVSSTVYNDTPAVEPAIRQLSAAICDRSESVRNQAMLVVGPAVKSCPFPRVVEYLLRDLTADVVLQNNAFSDLLQVYRDILSSLPLNAESEWPAFISASDRQHYHDVICGQLLPYLIGNSSNFDSHGGDGRFMPRIAAATCLYDQAPSDSERSTVLELVVSIIDLCGKGLTDSHFTTIFSTCWAVLQSNQQNLALRGQAIKASISFCRYGSQDWFSYIVTKAVTLLQEGTKNEVTTKDFLLLLKGLTSSYPLKLVGSIPSLLAVARIHSQSQEFDPGLEEDEELERFINVREASLGLYDIIFLVYTKFLPRAETATAASIAIQFLKFNPGLIDCFEDPDHQLYDEEDDYEEELGFGDLENSSWRLRVAAAKFIRTLAQTQPTYFQDVQNRSAVITALSSALKDKYGDVALHVSTALSVVMRLVCSPVFNATQPSSPSLRKRRRESSSEGVATSLQPPVCLDLSRQQAVLDGILAIMNGDSLAAKKEALILLAVMIKSQGSHGWEVFSNSVQPTLRLLQQADAQARFSGGTYSVQALGVVQIMLETYEPNLMARFAEDIVGALPIVVSNNSPTIATATLELIPSLLECLGSYIYPVSQTLADQLVEMVLGYSSSENIPAAVGDYATETLSQLLTTELPLGISSGRACMETILGRLSRDLSSQSAFKAVMTVSSSSLPGLFYLEWVSSVLKVACSKFHDPSSSAQASGFLLAMRISSNPQILPIFRSNPEVVRKLASETVPFLISASSDDNVSAHQSLNILVPLASEFYSEISAVNGFEQSLATLILKTKIQSPHSSSVISLMAEVGKHPFGITLAQQIYSDANAIDSLPLAGRSLASLLAASSSLLMSYLDPLRDDAKTCNDERKRTLALVTLSEMMYRIPTFLASAVSPQLTLRQIGPNGMAIEHQITAAVALGRAAAGIPSAYIPEILQAMATPIDTKMDDEGYGICIYSLAEFVEHSKLTQAPVGELEFSEKIWHMAFSAALTLPKTRPMAVRCMGTLMLQQPGLFQQAKAFVQNIENSELRGVGVSVLEFWILNQDRDSVDVANLTSVLETIFLPVFDDECIRNREYVALAINAASYRYPDAVTPILDQLLKSVLEATVRKPELIREVRMGPFLRQFDDGLAVRKSAYEILYTVVGNNRLDLDLVALLDRCVDALVDDGEVRLPICLILERIWDVVFNPISRGTTLATGPSNNRADGARASGIDSGNSTILSKIGWSMSDVESRKVRTLSPTELKLLETQRIESMCQSIRTTLTQGSKDSKPSSSQVDQQTEQTRRVASIRLAYHIYSNLATYYGFSNPSSSSSASSSSSTTYSRYGTLLPVAPPLVQPNQHFQHRPAGLRLAPLVVEIHNKNVNGNAAVGASGVDNGNVPEGMVCATKLWHEIGTSFQELAIRIETGVDGNP